MKHDSSDDKEEIRLPIEFGSSLITDGGWLERRSIYSGSLLGFRYGENFSSCNFRVMSRKLTVWLLTSAVILHEAKVVK